MERYKTSLNKCLHLTIILKSLLLFQPQEPTHLDLHAFEINEIGVKFPSICNAELFHLPHIIPHSCVLTSLPSNTQLFQMSTTYTQFAHLRTIEFLYPFTIQSLPLIPPFPPICISVHHLRESSISRARRSSEGTPY